MGYYLKTARNYADGHDLQFRAAAPVRFSITGWDEFSKWFASEAVEIRDILGRFDGPADLHPYHISLQHEGEAVSLAFTSDDCRRLFRALSAASDGGQRKEYDFWEFVSLVAAGIIEDGIVAY